MSEIHKLRKPYRSFFWPVILVAAGVIWLLVNLNMIPTENLWLLFQLWPILIIMAGLDILFARRLPLVGALLGLAVAAGVVYILLSGESLGIQNTAKPQTETFTVEVGNTTSVEFDLNLSIQKTTVHVLNDSANLLEAEIDYAGNINFTESETQEKQIELTQTNFPAWFSWIMPNDEGEPMTWDIGLSPEVPFKLDVDASTGASYFDLSDIQLEELVFDASTGASTIILPPSIEGYDVSIDGSTGNIDLILPEEGNLNLYLEGSTGKITLNLTENAAVQIKVLNGGTGDLYLPEQFSKINGQEDRDEGIYQTNNFENADFQIVITIENISTGDMIIE